jgi:hypothetical protein
MTHFIPDIFNLLSNVSDLDKTRARVFAFETPEHTTSLLTPHGSKVKANKILNVFKSGGTSLCDSILCHCDTVP